MKKIILSLFLILGAVSFSALELDTNKIQKKNLQITVQDEVVVTLGKSEKDYEESIFYRLGKENEVAKDISQATVKTALKSQKVISSYETEKVYVVKFKEMGSGIISYSVVDKQITTKGWYVGIIFVPKKELSESELNKTFNNLLDEARNFIK